MSEIKVNSIKGVGASAAAITVNNTDGTATANLTNRQSRNLIINGDYKISQRHGTTSTAVTGVHKFVLDRWLVSTTSGGSTSMNVQQLHGNPTGAPYGFSSSMKMTVAAVDDGGADSSNVIQTRIENLNTDYLAFGTSSAKTVTLSFHVKSSLTGTFGGALVSGDFSRGNVFQYTISSANTWEKKTVTIVGDTTSTADSVYNRGDSGSLRGLVLYFDLGSGSNNEKSAANSWSATGVNGYGSRIAGNVKLCANNGADWGITGVQLEVGSVATDFEHRSYAQELALCQRYFCKNSGGSDAYVFPAKGNGSSSVDVGIPLCVPMRASPSVTCSASRFFRSTTAAISASSTNPSVAQYQANVASFVLALAVGGQGGVTNNEAGAWTPHNSGLELDAEL